MDAFDLRPVVWKDGVLIAPQHLQRQDLFHQASVQARLAALSPFHWGVVSLAADDGALKKGLVRFSEVSAVFADGTVVARGGEPAARPLGEAMAPTATSLDVYVAVPTFRDGLENYSGAANTRYRTITRRDVVDLSTAHSKVDLEVAEPNLEVLLGDEVRRAGASVIKVGEIVRGPDGGHAWSPTYLPPSLALAPLRRLTTELRELLGLVIAKRRALVELRRERDTGNAEFLGGDVTRYLLLDGLNHGISYLRHLVDEPSTHPLTAFLWLREFASKLTSFAVEVDPSTFPAFSYVDLRGAFDPLLRQIRAMLGLTVREAFIRLPLTLRAEDGMLLARLADDGLLSCAAYVLAVESTQAADEVAERLPRLSKIASWSRITIHLKQATPGIKVRHLREIPAELPRRPRLVYFAIATDDQDWHHVITERTLAVFLPEPFNPRAMRVELLGVLRQEKGDVHA